MGLPPRCTVGAAEFEPPASGRIALFSIAMEFGVFLPTLPEVAALRFFARRVWWIGRSLPQQQAIQQKSPQPFDESLLFLAS
jgi:hypothetical protein